MRIPVLFLLMGMMLAGCTRSGTWKDDPGNWQKAFNSAKPPEVTVVHSQYWSSAHWTYEFSYFFHVRKSEFLQKQLSEGKKLKQATGREVDRMFTGFFSDKPGWFLPRPPENYEVWIPADNSSGNFRLFIEKDTGDLFITDHQV